MGQLSCVGQGEGTSVSWPAVQLLPTQLIGGFPPGAIVALTVACRAHAPPLALKHPR